MDEHGHFDLAFISYFALFVSLLNPTDLLTDLYYHLYILCVCVSSKLRSIWRGVAMERPYRIKQFHFLIHEAEAPKHKEYRFSIHTAHCANVYQWPASFVIQSITWNIYTNRVIHRSVFGLKIGASKQFRAESMGSSWVNKYSHLIRLRLWRARFFLCRRYICFSRS